MTDAAEEALVSQVVSGVPSEGNAPVVYVNSALVRASPYDFQFVLGQTAGIAKDKAVIVNHLLTLVMSPQHAKALSDVLSQHVRAFEELMGPIQVGPKEDTTTPTPDAIEPAPPSAQSPTGASSKASRRGKRRP